MDIWKAIEQIETAEKFKDRKSIRDHAMALLIYIEEGNPLPAQVSAEALRWYALDALDRAGFDVYAATLASGGADDDNDEPTGAERPGTMPAPDYSDHTAYHLFN